MGMEPEAIPHMFEMFSRGNRDNGRHQAGLGIGLALSRRLADMHGGTLNAHSDGPGRSATFTVRLPIAELARETPPAPSTPDASLDKKRVLVVDDNRDAGDTLGMILSELGAEVRVVHDGMQALEAFAAYHPAVVLLDIGMPGMNGYEVAGAIRSRFPGQTGVLVALTGWGQEDDRRRAKEAGFNHHITKPVEIEALQQLLANI